MPGFISSRPLRAWYLIKPIPSSLQVVLTNGGHALLLHLGMHLRFLAAACGSVVLMERLQSEFDQSVGMKPSGRV